MAGCARVIRTDKRSAAHRGTGSSIVANDCYLCHRTGRRTVDKENACEPGPADYQPGIRSATRDGAAAAGRINTHALLCVSRARPTGSISCTSMN